MLGYVLRRELYIYIYIYIYSNLDKKFYTCRNLLNFKIYSYFCDNGYIIYRVLLFKLLSKIHNTPLNLTL
jgi:hypothetical protein